MNYHAMTTEKLKQIYFVEFKYDNRLPDLFWNDSGKEAPGMAY